MRALHVDAPAPCRARGGIDQFRPPVLSHLSPRLPKLPTRVALPGDVDDDVRRRVCAHPPESWHDEPQVGGVGHRIERARDGHGEGDGDEPAHEDAAQHLGIHRLGAVEHLLRQAGANDGPGQAVRGRDRQLQDREAVSTANAAPS